MPKKKIIKKKVAAKKPVKTVRPKVDLSRRAPAKAEKPIGVVTHFYGNINVGIFKFKKPVKVGTTIAIRGATTDFKQTIDSMQYDHQPIMAAPKGKEIGIKVKKKVHEGDSVFPA